MKFFNAKWDYTVELAIIPMKAVRPNAQLKMVAGGGTGPGNGTGDYYKVVMSFTIRLS